MTIVWFEHRNSDNICALRWYGSATGINPPVCIALPGVGELAYPSDFKWDVTYQVEWDEANKMALWIQKQVEEHLAKYSPKNPIK